MPARKIYDCAVKTRTYVDVRSGETKGVWQNVGAVWKSDDGNSWVALNRWFNPAGVPCDDNRDTINISMFTPKDRSEGV